MSHFLNVIEVSLFLEIILGLISLASRVAISVIDIIADCVCAREREIVKKPHMLMKANVKVNRKRARL